MKVKIKKKKGANQTDKLKESMKDLGKQKVEVGHFKETATSSNDRYQGMSYVELLSYWATGGASMQHHKRPLNALQTKMPQLLTNKDAKAAFKVWSSKLPTKMTNDKLVEAFGEFIRDQYKNIFGTVGAFMPAVGNNATPLLDTGELQSATGYKTKRSKTVKQGA